MNKTKRNHDRQLAKYNSKKESNMKKNLNPFEIHINRQKIRIMGHKAKNERGVPGISRSKALKKRTHTLLQEYNVYNKSNKFIDKRIGEGNRNMTEEDRGLARYTALRTKSHRKSIFNLADDEILTHRGQTLNEIENFDDPRSDEESSDENHSGKLDSSFVEEAHFGGGLLKDTGVSGAKSHKDLINQLIAESKKRKAEQQKMKDQTMELTEKLDNEWKDLLPIVNNTKKIDNPTLENKTDDYDKVVQQLKFEARGTPSDRLKTQDEIAKEEKEKLESLEGERLERMRGFVEEKHVKKTHRSADDLEDNFAYDSESEAVLSYNVKGESNFKVNAEVNGQQISEKSKNSDAHSDDFSNEEDSNASMSDEDNLSDLKEDLSDSDDETDQQNTGLIDNDKIEQELNLIERKEDAAVTFSNISSQKQQTESGEELVQNSNRDIIRTDLLQRKEIMDKAKKELPYTFNIPEDYESLQEILEDKTNEEQSVIIGRMIKCNHPSLADGNKERLGMLFVYLLQHVSDISSELIDKKSIIRCFEIYNSIVPCLYDLAHINQENSHKAMLEVIKEKQADFRKTFRKYPGIDVLLFLKLISCLFPTSDFRHPVVTTSLVYMDQMLNNCKVKSRRDIAYGLFLVTLILEYTNLSKRYLPSAINFLSGILHMSIPKLGIQLIKISPPFKSTSSSLVLFNPFVDENTNYRLQVTDLFENIINDEFKVRSLYNVLCLTREFVNHFNELPSNYEIFENLLKYLQMIHINNYPKEIICQCNLLKDDICALRIHRKLQYIVMEKKRPKALRLYEPNIQKVFDGKRHKIQSKEKAERAKLLHKVRKEHKGALREIRRDNTFLGRIKVSRQIQSDLERKHKVKSLLADASIQQSELNELDRKRKRK